MPVGANVFDHMESLLDKAIENAKREGRIAGNQEGYRRGVRAAAEIADSYNSSTIHRGMLGDCIMAKLNVGRGKIRKNKRRIVQYGDGTAGIPKGSTALCADGSHY